MRPRITLSILCIALLALTLWAVPAMAQTPTQDAYGGLGGEQQSAVTTSGSKLPFTGFDVAIVAIVGLALTGTGLAVRHVTRRGDTT